MFNGRRNESLYLAEVKAHHQPGPYATAPIPEKDRALLRFVGKKTKSLPAVDGCDIDSLKALFNFYNRWITASGVAEMSEEAHREQGRRIAAHGCTRE